jgi:hypothetical protein
VSSALCVHACVHACVAPTRLHRMPQRSSLTPAAVLCCSHLSAASAPPALSSTHIPPVSSPAPRPAPVPSPHALVTPPIHSSPSFTLRMSRHTPAADACRIRFPPSEPPGPLPHPHLSRAYGSHPCRARVTSPHALVCPPFTADPRSQKISKAHSPAHTHSTRAGERTPMRRGLPEG